MQDANSARLSRGKARVTRSARACLQPLPGRRAWPANAVCGRRVHPPCAVLRVVLTLLAVFCGLTARAQPADDPVAWLDRMTGAAQELSYDGTFVYHNGAQMETMRIIHRADTGGERSRLISLSGIRREVLRDSRQVICILPDDKSVLVAKSRPPRVLSSALLVLSAGFVEHYRISVADGGRVAGRATQRVYLEPADDYRYGYKLWVDRDTGLLLKSDVLSETGMPLEQFIYTSITLPADIPDSLLEPGISGRALTWHLPQKTADQDTARESKWRVTWLPAGFMMRDHGQQPVPSSDTTAEQLVYTDGLASISVFVEALAASDDMLEGLSAMGALNAYGRVVDGFQVTVVGEVPARTVEAVAGSVSRP